LNFIGGIGYYMLSDYGVGPLIVDVLRSLDLNDTIVEDLSYNTVAIYHRLIEGDYSKIILVGARKTGSSSVGHIRVYNLDEVNEPDESTLQRYIGDSVGGLIDIGSVTYFLKYYASELEKKVSIIEIEAGEIREGNKINYEVVKSLPYLLKLVLEKVNQESLYSIALQKLNEILRKEYNVILLGD